MREPYGKAAAPRPNRDRYQYGYDYSSNRLWRENSLTHGTAKEFDEYYTYDGLDRLTNADRGTLDDPPAEGLLAGTTSFRQGWGLDPVGNWDTFKWDSNGLEPCDATQNRGHSKANRVTLPHHNSKVIKAA